MKVSTEYVLSCDPQGTFTKIKRFKARMQAICKWLKVDYTGKEKSFYGAILHLKNDNCFQLNYDI